MRFSVRVREREQHEFLDFSVSLLGQYTITESNDGFSTVQSLPSDKGSKDCLPAGTL